jgi:sugar lactone lactonase YvrE
MILLLACLLITVQPAVAPAQSDPVVDSRKHFRAAVEAYEAGDRAAYLEHAREAQALRPEHGGVTWALASALALTGDTAGAFRTLRHFAALGYFGDLAADSDFAGLRGSAAYEVLTRRLDGNRTPVVASRVAFDVPQPDLLTEGIAYDSATGVFFIGSVRKGKILRVAGAGRTTDFVTVEGGRWAPLGLRVDGRRRILWVAAAALPQVAAYQAADSGRSAILRYDLRSGRLTGRYEPRDADPHAIGDHPHAIGDLIVNRGGDVFATDSRAPVVYRIAAGADSLERFIRSPLLLSAQGLALTADERSLYVADYSRGILRVNLADRGVTLLQTADSVLALGIDGLYYHRGHLIGIQNGVEPHRVVRFTLAPGGDGVLEGKVLERAHPRYDEPTLGVLVGGDLFYIANSQWERFGQDGRIADSTGLQRPVVLRLPL